MSKQSEAKKRQGYDPIPMPKNCGTCWHYQSDVICGEKWGGSYREEKGKRCGLGGFAVKKTAVCLQHKRKDNEI